MKTDSTKISVPEPLDLPYVKVKFLLPPTPRTITEVENIPHTSVVMYNEAKDQHVIFYLQYEIKDLEIKRMDRNVMRRYFYNQIINRIIQANIVTEHKRCYPMITLPPHPRLARNFRQEQQPTGQRDNTDDTDSLWNSLLRMVEYENDKEAHQSILNVGTNGNEPVYGIKLNLGNYLTFTAFKNDPNVVRHREMITSACSGTCTVDGQEGYNFAVRSVLWWERGLNKLCGMLNSDRLQTRIYDTLDKSFGKITLNSSLLLSDLKFNNQE
jgi:hypothetical protein